MVSRPAIVDGDVARIPLTRGMFALVDRIDADLADGQLWTALKRRQCWHAYHLAPRPCRRAIYLHRIVAERVGLAIDGLLVDHRNGDGLDCRRENLRAATVAENTRNGPLRSSNVSGFKGVRWVPHTGKWRASIKVGGREVYLGQYATIEAAAAAYALAARNLHGEFARVG